MTTGALAFDGKVAIITGAARGIGAATARLAVERGARVVVADRRGEEAETVAADLNAHVPASAVAMSLDVASEEGWQQVVRDTESEFGRLDILVNNAGIIRVGPLGEMTADMFRLVIDTNLVGTFLGIKHGQAAMGRVGGGAIVNLSSVHGFEGREGLSAYSASKFGIRGLTKTAAIELGPLGIRVNTVIPGPTRTKMTERPGWEQADYDLAYRGFPLARMADAREVAEVILFLCSDAASFCTGGDFAVDGGITIGKPRSVSN